jgi:hypothetical protein
MRIQATKVRLVLGLVVSGLVFGCAANTPYSETVIDTSTGSQKRGLPETPVYRRPMYTPGANSDTIGLGEHF